MPQDLSPYTAFRHFKGHLHITGKTGGSDSLGFVASPSVDEQFGRLDNGFIEGFGLIYGKINFNNVKTLNVWLGDKGDSFELSQVPAQVTQLNVHGGRGAATITVKAAGLRSSTALTLKGGANAQTDTLVVDATAMSSATTTTLTSTAIFGTILGGANANTKLFAHSLFKTVRLRMGSGADNVTVTPLSSGTSVEVFGGAGNDRLIVDGSTGIAKVYGEKGEDEITLYAGKYFMDASTNPCSRTQLLGNQPVTLDGGEGSDTHHIYFSGGFSFSTQVNIADSGAASSSQDSVSVYGTGTADTVLVRSGYIALLNPKCAGRQATVERLDLGSRIWRQNRFPPPEKNELVLSIEMGCSYTVHFVREPNTPF